MTRIGYPYILPEDCTGIVILDNDESRDYYPEAIEAVKASKLPCAVIKDYKVGSIFPILLMMGVLDLSSITGKTKISLDTIGEGENAFVIPMDPDLVTEIAAGYISVQQLVFGKIPSAQDVRSALSRIFSYSSHIYDLNDARMKALPVGNVVGECDSSTLQFADALIKGELRFDPPPAFSPKILVKDDDPDTTEPTP